MRQLIALALVAGFAAAETEVVTFALPDTEGKTVRVADFRSRYVLLVYQGIPCPPSEVLAPKLSVLHDSFRRPDLTVAAIYIQT